MKDKASSKVANEKLEPLIRYVHGRRGAITEVVRRLSARTKKQWRRENAERWLHPDAKKRTQPLFGVGLLLMEIGQELLAEQEAAKLDKAVDAKLPASP